MTRIVAAGSVDQEILALQERKKAKIDRIMGDAEEVDKYAQPELNTKFSFVFSLISIGKAIFGRVDIAF